jgi:hypothetical protein
MLQMRHFFKSLQCGMLHVKIWLSFWQNAFNAMLCTRFKAVVAQAAEGTDEDIAWRLTNQRFYRC